MNKNRKLLATILLILVGTIAAGNGAFAKSVKLDFAHFPDAALRNALNTYYEDLEYDEEDRAPKGYIETDDVTELYVLSNNGTVKDLTGINLLTNLSDLYMGSYSGSTISLINSKLKAVEIENSTASTVNISVPNVTEFALSLYGNTKTVNVSMPNASKLEYYGSTQTVNLNNCANLINLHIAGNNIKTVKGISDLSRLQGIEIYNTQLSSLDLTKNTKLTTVSCSGNNKLAVLKVPKTLKSLLCSNNSSLKTLDVSGCKGLVSLYASDNNLKSINVKKNTNLTDISLAGNKKLTSVNVTKNKKLKYLNVSVTGVKKLNLTKNTKLTSLSCYETKISNLNLKKNKKLNSLSIYGTKIKKLNLSGYKKMSVGLQVKKGKTLDLKNFFGTGYKCTEKSSNVKYSQKNNTVKIKGTFGTAYLTLRKGKKKYSIEIHVK